MMPAMRFIKPVESNAWSAAAQLNSTALLTCRQAVLDELDQRGWYWNEAFLRDLDCFNQSPAELEVRSG